METILGPGHVTSTGLIEGERRYCLNTCAKIVSLDTSASEPMYQVLLGSRRVQINERTLEILKRFNEPRSISEALALRPGVSADDCAAQVTSAVMALASRGIVLEVDDAGIPLTKDASLLKGSTQRKHPLALHVRLLTREQVLPLSSTLKYIFEGRVFQILLAFIVIAHFIFFLNDQVMHIYGTRGATTHTAGEWALIVLCVYLSVLFHEIGHCAACEYYGVKHGEIGAGLLFVYPVFYADVAECWLLPRLRRAVVDSAGIYFQLLVSAAACLVWVYTGGTLLRIFIYSTVLTALFNMNPFMRMDGYWLLADLSGIPNLYKASAEVFRYGFSRARHRNRTLVRPELFSRPGWIVALVVLHGIGTTLFFMYFIAKIALQVLPNVARVLPENFTEIWRQVSHYHFSGQLAHLLIVSFFLCAAAVGALRFCFRMCLACWKSNILRELRCSLGDRLLAGRASRG